MPGQRRPRWLQARQADLLPVEYYHLVFTLSAPVSELAWYNKSLLYGLLFQTAAETFERTRLPRAPPGGWMQHEQADYRP